MLHVYLPSLPVPSLGTQSLYPMTNSFDQFLGLLHRPFACDLHDFERRLGSSY